jgi:hypothetical protein
VLLASLFLVEFIDRRPFLMPSSHCSALFMRESTSSIAAAGKSLYVQDFWRVLQKR